jgi:hypothetical protein
LIVVTGGSGTRGLGTERARRTSGIGRLAATCRGLHVSPRMGAAYNCIHMNEFSYRPTSKLRAFFATRRVLGWTPWQRRKRQVALGGYSLTLEQATGLETFLRGRSIEAFVCPSLENEDVFSVAVWYKDRKRALVTLADKPVDPPAR